MTLFEFIKSQGIPDDAAMDLVLAKKSQPRLVTTTYKGKYVKLCLPTPSDGDRFNQMILTGQTPYLQTDSVFMSGTENGRQFQDRPEAGEAYRTACEARGGSVKGKKYLSSLARFPGDPEAFVSGRGDVARICEERGLGCEGAVTVKKTVRDEAPKKSVPLAPDILADAVQAQVAGKDLSRKEVGDITEKTRESLTPSWKKRGVR